MKKSDRRSFENVRNGAAHEAAGFSELPGIDARKSDSAISENMSEAGFALSESEAALLDSDSSIPGRISDARAARMLGAIVARTGGPRWTADHVKSRLRDAALNFENVERRVGPATVRGCWPEPSLYANSTDEDRNVWWFAEKNGTRAPGAHSGSGGARDIACWIEALQWPLRYLGAEENEPPRKALQLWIWCEAKNQSFGEFFRALGCSRRTAYRRRDAAFEIILAGVVRDGVSP